jgi:hypothetical protein
MARKNERRYSYSTHTAKNANGGYDWHVERLDSELNKVIVASGTEETKIAACIAARDARRAAESPKSYFDVTATHMQPIVNALIDGDAEKAGELLTALVESIPGIKSFEVAMLREKAMKEAGLIPARRRKA